MDKESISLCSSCKSILEYSSSIDEPYSPNEQNSIERSIENDEIGLNINEKQNKKREEGEDFVEKLIFRTNKKIKHLAPDDKNITRITCAESGNNDFYVQDIKQRNDCKTEKANNSTRDKEKNTETINNGFQSPAQNILDYRKNIFETARSLLELRYIRLKKNIHQAIEILPFF